MSTTDIGWVIDRDYLNTGEEFDVPSRVGVGQRCADIEQAGWNTVTIERGLSSGDVAGPVRFRLLDDDGEIYYGGAMRRDWLDGDEELAFAPLAFGTADAGCTELQYRDGEEWRTL